jgi:group I intron endonuclease
MKKVKIYYISNNKNPNQPIYIGITSRDLKTRLSEHIRNNNFGKFKDWINLQIKNNVDILISEIETVSKEKTKTREIFWIQHFKESGFEILNGNNGGGGPIELTNEQKNKLSKSRTGDKNPFYGKSHSDNSLKKISDNNSKYWLGKKLSKEAIQKRSKKRNISIIQLDKNGNFIKTWKSISEASETLNIDPSSIVKVLKNKRKIAGNYVWKYKK